MQKQDPIDDLFRRKLADYKVTPSAERRAAFMRDIGKTTKRPGLWWLIGGTLIVLLGIVGAVQMLEDKSVVTHNAQRVEFRNDQIVHEAQVNSKTDGIGKSNENKSEKKVNVTVAKTRSATIGDIKSTTPALYASTVKVAAPVTVVANVQTAAPVTMAANVQAAVPVTLAANVQASDPTSEASNDQTANQPTTTSNDPVASRIPDTTSAQSAIIPDTTSAQSTIISNPREAPSSRISHLASAERSEASDPISSRSASSDIRSLSKKWNISAGVYYTPEWMFNTLNGDKFVNSMGVEGTFHFGNYSVRTGAGLSITTGSNEMLARTNPYLGSYNALDSITFKWDEQHNLTPTFYMSGQTVYDTTLKYNYSYNKKRYTYLQVPLVLGYDFWQNNWLSLGVRAGAVMSLLLSTQELSGTYDPGKDRIITINNVSPDRIQLNWQAIGGINAAFRLSRRFSIELEPDLRYYFDSVYEPSELTKKPWSVGIRAAVLMTW